MILSHMVHKPLNQIKSKSYRDRLWANIISYCPEKSTYCRVKRAQCNTKFNAISLNEKQCASLIRCLSCHCLAVPFVDLTSVCRCFTSSAPVCSHRITGNISLDWTHQESNQSTFSSHYSIKAERVSLRSKSVSVVVVFTPSLSLVSNRWLRVSFI